MRLLPYLKSCFPGRSSHRLVTTLIFLLSLACAPFAQAAEYFVSTTGSDSNNGLTAGSAFASLSYGVNKLQAGDTLWVLPGRYYQRFTVWEKNGTPSAWITISGIAGQARPIIDLSHTGGSVFMGGTDTTTSYLHINHIAIANSPDNHGLIGANLSYVTIEDSEFYGNYGNGIYLYGPGDHSSVLNNSVHGNVLMNKNGVNLATALWSQGICISAQTDGLIAGNDVRNNWGEGIDLLGRDSYAGNTVVRNNVVADNWSVEIYIDHASDNIIEDNIISSFDSTYFRSGAGASGVAIADEGGNTTDASNNNIIRNNIIVGTSSGFRYGKYGLSLGLQNTQIVNNTFVGYTGQGIMIDDGGTHSGNLIANNIFSSTVSGAVAAYVPNTTGVSYQNNLWSGVSWGRLDGAGDVLADPLLQGGCTTVPQVACYALTALSPAIAAGTPLSTVTEDYRGTARPAIPAIGALEFVALTSTTSLAASTNPINEGATLTITATVKGQSGTPLSGLVTLYDGATVLGTQAVTAVSAGTAQASFALSGLGTGTHAFTATYSDDSAYASSLSTVLSVSVSSTTLPSNAIPALSPLALLALVGLLMVSWRSTRRA